MRPRRTDDRADDHSSEGGDPKDQSDLRLRHSEVMEEAGQMYKECPGQLQEEVRQPNEREVAS